MSISIGDILKQAREDKQITLEEVSEETKIQKRYLKALEEERFEELPGEVHVKGFMRNYCKAVGLNPDEIIEEYKKIKEKQVDEVEEIEIKETNTKKVILIFIGIIAIIFIIFILKNTFINSNLDSSSQKLKYEKIQERNTSSTEVEKVISKEVKTIKEELKEEAKEETEEDKNEQNKEILSESNNKTENKVEKIETQNKITEIPKKITKKLKIVVNGKSWMEIKKDNNVIFKGTIVDKEKIIEGTDKEKIELKIGNAGSVKLIYNEEDLGVLGKQRQVVRRKF